MKKWITNGLLTLLCGLAGWCALTMNSNHNDIIIIKESITKIQSDISDIRTQTGRYEELFDQDEHKIAWIEGKLGITH
jgi:hypothetical protein